MYKYDYINMNATKIKATYAAIEQKSYMFF